MSPKLPRIAILGAGPAGLSLAHLLLKASIPVTIYEHDLSPTTRSQGGSLDLHTSTGQQAIKECGLWDQFLEHARYDGEALAVMDKNMKVYLRVPQGKEGKSNGRPEIDRGAIRKILVEGLPEGVVKWGMKVREVTESEDGDGEARYTIHFTDGSSTSDVDLLVGADGAWSKVRPLLIDAKPYFTGLGGFDMVIPGAATTYPDISKVVNKGSVFAFNDGQSMALQQRGDGAITVYAWSRRHSENWMNEIGFDVHDPVAVKRYLTRDFENWKWLLGQAPLVTDDGDITPRSLYVLPINHRWDGKKGVTLIGDAAHLMSPFAGEGVNLAMADAMDLAHALEEGMRDGDWHVRVKGFEERMFERAGPIQRLSQAQMEAMFFNAGVPRTQIAGWLQRAIGGARFEKWWLGLVCPKWIIEVMLRCIFWW
ncbi:MAG: hypothetical protein Q9174_002812 [Haloplaca sp. 1 TL-2023]